MRLKNLSKASGFTLVEILIALLIFSIIAGILALSLRSMLQTRRAVDSYQARLSQLQLATLILHRDLTQISLQAVQIQNQSKASVEGESQTVQFIRGGEINPLELEARSTLLQVHYRFQSGRLYRETENLFSSNKTRHTQILLQNIETLTWHYIATDHRIYDKWPRSQREATEVPAGMMLTLQLKDLGTLEQTFLIGLGN